jgi:hypothetical protein
LGCRERIRVPFPAARMTTSNGVDILALSNIAAPPTGCKALGWAAFPAMAGYNRLR